MTKKNNPLDICDLLEQESGHKKQAALISPAQASHLLARYKYATNHSGTTIARLIYEYFEGSYDDTRPFITGDDVCAWCGGRAVSKNKLKYVIGFIKGDEFQEVVPETRLFLKDKSLCIETGITLCTLSGVKPDAPEWVEFLQEGKGFYITSLVDKEKYSEGYTGTNFIKWLDDALTMHEKILKASCANELYNACLDIKQPPKNYSLNRHIDPCELIVPSRRLLRIEPFQNMAFGVVHSFDSYGIWSGLLVPAVKPKIISGYKKYEFGRFNCYMWNRLNRSTFSSVDGKWFSGELCTSSRNKEQSFIFSDCNDSIWNFKIADNFVSENVKKIFDSFLWRVLPDG